MRRKVLNHDEEASIETREEVERNSKKIMKGRKERSESEFY